MDYLLLLGACFFFSLQFIFQKLFEQMTKSGLSVCLWNVFMSCTVSALFLLIKAGFPQKITGAALVIAALYAASSLVCTVSSIGAMRFGSISVISTYCLAGGMVLPFFYGIIFLEEPSSIWKWLGIIVLCTSLFPSVAASGKDSEKSDSKSRTRFFILCILIFFSNGFVSIFSKMHQISKSAIDENHFVMIASVITLTAALILKLISATSKSANDKNAFRNEFVEIGSCKMTVLLFVILIVLSGGYAICNAVGNLFSLACMVTMDASIQFPVLSAVIIIFSAIFGRVFFREKFTKPTIISLLLAVAGIALFAIN